MVTYPSKYIMNDGAYPLHRSICKVAGPLCNSISKPCLHRVVNQFEYSHSNLAFISSFFFFKFMKHVHFQSLHKNVCQLILCFAVN